MSSLNGPISSAALACSSNYGYLKFHGAKVRELELSMTGSFEVYKFIVEWNKSRVLNCAQLTVTWHLLESLINKEALIGPMTKMQSVHLSIVIYAVLSKMKT